MSNNYRLNNSPNTLRKDYTSNEKLQGQFKRYPQQSELNKVTIISNFYDVIQKQRKTILELQGKLQKLEHDKFQSDSNDKIKQNLEALIQRRNESSNKEIELLKKEVEKVKGLLKEQRQRKLPPKIQIIVPSEVQIKQGISKQINQQLQIQAMKQKIQFLQASNQKYLSSLNQEKTKYSKLNQKITQKIKELSNDSNLKQQIRQKQDKYQKLLKQNGQLKNNLDICSRQISAKKESSKKFVKLVVQAITSGQQPSQKEVRSKLAALGKRLDESQLSQDRQKQAISLIQKLIDTVNKTINELKINYQSLSQEHNALKLNKESLDEQLATLSQERAKLTNQKKILTEDNTKIKRQLTSQRQTSKKLQDASKKLQDASKKLQDNIKNLNSSISSLQKKLQTKQTEFQLYKQNALTEIKRLSATKQKNQIQIQRLNTVIQAKNKQSIQLQKTIEDYMELIRGYQQDVSLKKAQITDRQKDIKLLNDKIKELNAIIKSNQTTITKNNDQINKITMNNSKLQLDTRDLNKKLSSTKQELEQTQEILTKINKKLIGLSSQIFISQNKMLKAITPDKSKQLDKQIQQIINLWANQFNGAKFFNGSEITQKQSNDWILRTLQNYVKETPYQTKLIYKYDPINPANFHQYIDKVRNLLVLVKISNGTIIGGFTVYQFDQEKIIRPGKGFIFNLNYKKAYYMRNEPRLPVTGYDDYYMILGNAEIRLRCQQSKVFSNFGIANSTFDNGSDPRTKFLGVSDMMNNELEIDTYEFYQINFRQ